MMLGRHKRKKKQGPYYKYLRIAAIVFSALVILLVVFFATKAWLSDLQKKNAPAGAATPLPARPADTSPASTSPADSGQSRNEERQGPEIALPMKPGLFDPVFQVQVNRFFQRAG